MADAVLLLALLLASGAAVLSLVRSSARRWQRERAGLPYELPVNYRGAAQRAAAALLVALVTAGTAVPLLSSAVRKPDAAAAPDPAPPDDRPPFVGPPQLQHQRHSQHRPRRPRSHPQPLIRMPRPSGAPTPTSPRTVAHPARGSLDVLFDGTEVWVPPRYPKHDPTGPAYPLVVAHLPAGDAADEVFQGFAAATARGLADPVVSALVTGCHRDADPLLRDLARYNRALGDGHARGALGLGSAPCAIPIALRSPGRCPCAAVPAEHETITASPGIRRQGAAKPAPHLSAAARDDTSARQAARELRTALAPFVEPRVVDAVIGPRPADDHRRLFTVAPQHFAEHLDGPALAPRRTG